jgi:diguanylate cyclase (GGDEF)-like protein
MGGKVKEPSTAAHFRRVLDCSRDAYVEVDARLAITEWSRRAEVLLGWTREEAVGQSVATVLAPEFNEVIQHALTVVHSPAEASAGYGVPAADEFHRPLPIELEFRHRDGGRVATNATIFSLGEGEDYRLCGFLHEGTRAPASEPDLGRLHDTLTGLPGRALFSRRLALALGSLRRSGRSVAVVVVDVDRFQTVNDSLGHEAGDEILVEVVRRLRGAVGHPNRPLLARLGGDAFLALFECDDGDARGVAEAYTRRLMEAMAEPFQTAGTELFLSASAGITATPDPDADASLVLADADAAMHQAKASGGGFRVFGQSMRHHVVERLSTEHALHRALDRGELTLFYQPVLDISGGATVGVEALLRWRHPQRGLMAPERFIPVAEESGLIIPIGTWVLEEACRQFQQWRSAGPARLGPAPTVEVNLSAVQVESDELVPTVESILATTGMPPEQLTLEITESALMRDADAALQVLTALKSLGVSLAVDDFGTGYSSLSYLRRFPLDLLKVDKSFVDELEDERGRAIVAAVIELAHALGLRVVAEGVETEAQLAALAELGCDQAQGFLFAKPVPATQLAAPFAIGA